MSKIRVDLESVQVTEGEGIGGGDFELRIQVQFTPRPVRTSRSTAYYLL